MQYLNNRTNQPVGNQRERRLRENHVGERKKLKEICTVACKTRKKKKKEKKRKKRNKQKRNIP
jgi:hypothetical protein